MRYNGNLGGRNVPSETLQKYMFQLLDATGGGGRGGGGGLPPACCLFTAACRLPATSASFALKKHTYRTGNHHGT